MARFLMAAGAAALGSLMLPVPADAQAFRSRTVLVYGDDPCPPAANPDEVVICARRPEEERFRIPRPVREAEAEEIRRRDDVPAQRGALAAAGRETIGGPGSCSPQGPGGEIGCAGRAGIDIGRAVRTVRDAVEVATTPTDD